jgi:hypothetical protein
MTADLISGLQKHINTHENDRQHRSQTRFSQANARRRQVNTLMGPRVCREGRNGGRRGGEGREKDDGGEKKRRIHLTNGPTPLPVWVVQLALDLMSELEPPYHTHPDPPLLAHPSNRPGLPRPRWPTLHPPSAQQDAPNRRVLTMRSKFAHRITYAA